MPVLSLDVKCELFLFYVVATKNKICFRKLFWTFDQNRLVINLIWFMGLFQELISDHNAKKKQKTHKLLENHTDKWFLK